MTGDTTAVMMQRSTSDLEAVHLHLTVPLGQISGILAIRSSDVSMSRASGGDLP